MELLLRRGWAWQRAVPEARRPSSRSRFAEAHARLIKSVRLGLRGRSHGTRVGGSSGESAEQGRELRGHLVRADNQVGSRRVCRW